MGCTSSAPNTLSANASKEDKSIQLLQEGVEETNSKHVETIDTESENRNMQVLPPSDTTEPVQLVSKYKSSTSLEPEKDLNTNGHIVESESSETAKDTKEQENNDKISKLKLDVLGKFIEITQQDANHDRDIKDSNIDETAELTELRKNEETDEKNETECNETCEDREYNSEEADEPSPSQSQSSRATRWEALADIAAELPPSLAVDPVTGQIYSLSK